MNIFLQAYQMRRLLCSVLAIQVLLSFKSSVFFPHACSHSCVVVFLFPSANHSSPYSPRPPLCCKLDAHPPPSASPTSTFKSHTCCYSVSVLWQCLWQGLGNNVQRAPLSCCELFSQHDTRLRSYVNWNYELRNAACFKKGKWVMSSAACFDTKSQVRRWGLLSKKKKSKACGGCTTSIIFTTFS